jgi:hypothetical protein
MSVLDSRNLLTLQGAFRMVVDVMASSVFVTTRALHDTLEPPSVVVEVEPVANVAVAGADAQIDAPGSRQDDSEEDEQEEAAADEEEEEEEEEEEMKAEQEEDVEVEQEEEKKDEAKEDEAVGEDAGEAAPQTTVVMSTEATQVKDLLVAFAGLNTSLKAGLAPTTLTFCNKLRGIDVVGFEMPIKAPKIKKNETGAMSAPAADEVTQEEQPLVGASSAAASFSSSSSSSSLAAAAPEAPVASVAAATAGKKSRKASASAASTNAAATALATTAPTAPPPPVVKPPTTTAINKAKSSLAKYTASPLLWAGLYASQPHETCSSHDRTHCVADILQLVMYEQADATLLRSKIVHDLVHRCKTEMQNATVAACLRKARRLYTITNTQVAVDLTTVNSVGVVCSINTQWGPHSNQSAKVPRTLCLLKAYENTHDHDVFLYVKGVDVPALTDRKYGLIESFNLRRRHRIRVTPGMRVVFTQAVLRGRGWHRHVSLDGTTVEYKGFKRGVGALRLSLVVQTTYTTPFVRSGDVDSMADIHASTPSAGNTTAATSSSSSSSSSSYSSSSSSSAAAAVASGLTKAPHFCPPKTSTKPLKTVRIFSIIHPHFVLHPHTQTPRDPTHACHHPLSHHWPATYKPTFPLKCMFVLFLTVVELDEACQHSDRVDALGLESRHEFVCQNPWWCAPCQAHRLGQCQQFDVGTHALHCCERIVPRTCTVH